MAIVDRHETSPLPPPRAGRAWGKFWGRWTGFDVAASAIALVVVIPILSVVGIAFTGDGTAIAHLASTFLPEYVANTLALGLLVVAGVLLIGVPAAWLVAACEFPGRRALEFALVLPMAAPAYVLAYAYADFLAAFGPVQSLFRAWTGFEVGAYWFPEIRSLPGAALMLTLVLYPYVYILARAHFLNQSAAALDAARSLGRSAWGSFVAVTLPLARPAIVAGAALALMETFADYGTVSYFGVQVFTTGIYRAWISLSDLAGAAQLATALLVFVALVLMLERNARGARAFHETGRRDRRPERIVLHGARSVAAMVACTLPPIFGFVIPVAVLISLLLGAGPPAREFSLHLLHSLVLAFLAGAVATCVAFVLGLARKQGPASIASRASFIAGLGYAVPGVVVAIGVLMPFAWFDNTLDSALRASFGVSSGLVLTGSIAGLVFAYTVRYLAVALQSVSAGLERITPSIEAAAKLLGRGPWDAVRRVYLPLIAPSALTAALLVFVDVMKELPATLMLRPFNFDTLAVAAHNYAADERLGHAAAPSLVIVAAGIVPCILLLRTISRMSEKNGTPET